MVKMTQGETTEAAVCNRRIDGEDDPRRDNGGRCLWLEDRW